MRAAAERVIVIRTGEMGLSRRILACASVIAAVMVMGWLVYLDFSFTATMPRKPDPTTGRVVPMIINHGHQIFVNHAEANRLENANLRYQVVGPLAGMGLVLALTKDLLPKRKKS